jgi:asparagine synthase (glutamine-hydrolysing)
VPFLDHELVEACATIPPELKVRRLETKHVLRLAARGLVPDRIIDKPKIGFFNAAVDGWFRAQLSGAASDYLLGPNLASAELLDPAVVRELAGAPTRNGPMLLRILMLEVWLRTFLPRATGTRERVVVAA